VRSGNASHGLDKGTKTVQSKRVIILIVAIAAAALAILFMVSYLNGADKRALSNELQVDVLIAKAPIAKGSLVPAGDAAGGFAEATTAPQRVAPPSKINSLDLVQNQIALIDIPAGVILTTEMFGDAENADNVTKSGFISNAGLTAISVSVDQVKAVAGILNPGDFVNIMIPVALEGSSAADLENLGITTLDGYMVLYQKAEILAIGQNFNVTAAQAQAGTTLGTSSSLMTFAVTPEAAMRIANHADSLYLTQVRSDYKPVPLPIIPSAELGTVRVDRPESLEPGRVPAVS